MPGNTSRRYSPVSLVVTVRVAPVSLLVIVTSADLITAWLLSVTVPCRVAVAVACPHMATQVNSIMLAMSAISNHRLRFILRLLLPLGWSLLPDSPIHSFRDQNGEQSLIAGLAG